MPPTFKSGLADASPVPRPARPATVQSPAPIASRVLRAPRHRSRPDLVAGLLIALIISLVGARDITRGGLGWSDAPNHVFDGILVLEFVRDLPLEDPRGWAEQFYLRHPALGFVVYWPPGFAVVEAAVFQLFGTDIAVARALILAFAWGAAFLLYRMGRILFDGETGLVAALLMASCFAGAECMTDILLEWPATFWVALAAWMYCRQTRTVQTRSLRGSWLCGPTIGVAFLTKQTAGFILPVIVLHALLSAAGRRWLLQRRTLTGFAVCIAFVLAYAIVSRPYAALPAQLLALDIEPSWYASRLPEITGWIVIVLALIGAVVAAISDCPFNEPRAPARAELDTRAVPTPIAAPLHAWSFLATWFTSWYGFSSVIEAKEPRYFFFGLPPLIFLAARGALGLMRPSRRRVIVVAAILLTQVGITIHRDTGRLPSYAPAVDVLMQRHDADLVLVDAVRDGQFIFDLYQEAGTHSRVVPLRASKLLYARAARMKYGGRTLVQSEADILALLDRYDIRYVVMESQAPVTQDATIDPPPRALLRALVTDASRFTRLGDWPLTCDDPAWDAVSLRVYEYTKCPARTADNITLPFPAMGRDVTIKLEPPAR